MLASKFPVFIIILAASCLINFGLVKAQEEDGEMENNSTVVNCFSCDGSSECAEDQDSDNSTSNKCIAGQHCWIWTTEEGDEDKSYRRACGEPCTDESREMDCKDTGNVTECSICCSRDLCNNGPINSAWTLRRNIYLWWWNLASVFLIASLTEISL